MHLKQTSNYPVSVLTKFKNWYSVGYISSWYYRKPVFFHLFC